MLAAGYVRYVCPPVTGAGCQSLTLTKSGKAFLHRLAMQRPTPQPSAVTFVPAILPHCLGCPTPLPTLPAYNPNPNYPGNAPLHPADLQSAYDFSNTAGGAGRTVAVLEIEHDPHLEHDLDIYREQFGLPPCTFANGCLREVDWMGNQTTFPPEDGDYTEVMLDIDVVSAVCAKCKILVVEVNPQPLYPWSAWAATYGVAVNTAVQLGAKAVSMSLADPEQNYPGSSPLAEEKTIIQNYYTHPGVVITASSGDLGWQEDPLNESLSSIPAVFPGVVAVGGTTLTPDALSLRGWDETAWSGSGSGCSLWLSAPSWETVNYCSGKRQFPDISFYADPFEIYLTNDATPSGEWTYAFGTSESAPAIAALYMLDSGSNTPQIPGVNGLYISGTFSPSAYFDITSGTNAPTGCAPYPKQLCNAGLGFDGLSGWGSPHGLNAFDDFY